VNISRSPGLHYPANGALTSPPNTSGITGARLADSSVTMKVAEVAT
jgi:hypothetical protein